MKRYIKCDFLVQNIAFFLRMIKRVAVLKYKFYKKLLTTHIYIYN